MEKNSISRRGFIKTGGLALGATLISGKDALAKNYENEAMQVWSCGGLAEAFIPANKRFEERTGSSIAYTGAFAGALGKSLLGSAKTEIFAPRVLKLAQKLKKEGKMLSYKPLCFTKYVVATPKGNPKGISGIADMGKNGVKTVIAPDASPPGGKAAMIILKKAGVEEGAIKNAVKVGDCVQTAVTDLVNGRGDAAVIEKRITELPQFKGKLDQFDIPEKFIPPVPVPFTIGIMKWAKNKAFAETYVNFVLSGEGQRCFEKAGFIPAISDEGQRLIKKYGVTNA
ncbi:MAG: ABC transporter substrate-binding protein [Desulfobacterales bacterium]|nr:ABC transporter substrate-binding protein [Desulfobacterales bacterium]MCP4161883.1 ABC transporter substrate-binding protein [Deltaproteobacteria bacterium]